MHTSINRMEDGLGEQGYILPCPVVRGSHLVGTRGLTLSHEMLFLVEGRLLCGKKILDQDDQDAEFCSGIFPMSLTPGGKISFSLSLSVPFCNW